ncbi:hypothetical protein AU476_30795 [Cupriavidus sp. UYMSc13B]|nr:hypothetical protein AU476_30795 [Cupriavidus sp. UYMSc13B]
MGADTRIASPFLLQRSVLTYEPLQTIDFLRMLYWIRYMVIPTSYFPSLLLEHWCTDPLQIRITIFGRVLVLLRIFEAH